MYYKQNTLTHAYHCAHIHTRSHAHHHHRTHAHTHIYIHMHSYKNWYKNVKNIYIYSKFIFFGKNVLILLLYLFYIKIL